MRAIEHSVEEEHVIKKAKMINNVGNEVPLLDIEEKKESCVTSNDGSQNSEVSSIAIEETNDICVGNMEKKETMELEKNNETSVKSVVTSSDEVLLIENKNSCVAYGGIKEDIRINPLVSQKKLLVLDLNGLLADIVNSPLVDVKPDITIGRKTIFKRPYCEEFLKFCFDKFEVGIWSSRKQFNVERITEFLLGNVKSKLLFCLDMSLGET